MEVSVNKELLSFNKSTEVLSLLLLAEWLGHVHSLLMYPRAA